jgi:CRP/FNR family cyclic AMP-dependent transcriptional regulator
MDKVEVLRNVDLFEGATEELLAKVAEVAEEKTFVLGEMIFEEGEKAEWVYILLDGKVRISIDLTSKPTYITVAMIQEPYWAFGWSGIVAPYRYTASATCEVETRVLAIPGIRFEEILDEEAECGCSVMKKLAELISSRLRNSRMTLLRTM